MVHGVIWVFLICGICWVSFQFFFKNFSFGDNNQTNLVSLSGNLALCRFHSTHVALRKPAHSLLRSLVLA